MASSIFYSILFLDPNQEHSRSLKDDNITFFNSENDLIKVLSSHDQVKYAICICCQHKRRILEELQRCSNVASISICKKHHVDPKEENGLINQSKFIRQSSFENSRLWQIEIHTDALNANDTNDQVTSHIRCIIQKLIEQDLYKTQKSIEE